MNLPKHKRRRLDIVVDGPAFSASTLGTDATVVSTQNRKLLRHASKATGGAANEAARAKVLSSRDLCAANQASLVRMG